MCLSNRRPGGSLARSSPVKQTRWGRFSDSLDLKLRSGGVLNLYVEDVIPREQTVRSIVAVVPEPSSVALVGIGCLAAVCHGVRRRERN